MPTYQYACTACEHRFEAVQKFTDDSLTVCPECAGALRKVYSSVGVVFKGSGFYRTDSRGGPVASGADGAKESGAKEGAGKDSAAKDTGNKDSGSSSTAAAKSGDSSSTSGTTKKSESSSGSSAKKSTTSAVPA